MMYIRINAVVYPTNNQNVCRVIHSGGGLAKQSAPEILMQNIDTHQQGKI